MGSTKTSDAYCSKDVNVKIAMGKQRMVELSTIWNDKNISQKLKLKLVKYCIWTVINFGAEGLILLQEYEKTDITCSTVETCQY